MGKEIRRYNQQAGHNLNTRVRVIQKDEHWYWQLKQLFWSLLILGKHFTPTCHGWNQSFGVKLTVVIFARVSKMPE